MSIQAALWRVVLCISVIFNGSALASMSMPMPSPLHQQPHDHVGAGTSRASIHPACHEQAADMESVAAHPHPPSSPLPGKGRHATPDCCAAGSCACVCVQSQAGIAIAGFDRLGMHAMTARQARARHDEPVLPHLIRPPIG
jgi:hypothetical protein